MIRGNTFCADSAALPPFYGASLIEGALFRERRIGKVHTVEIKKIQTDKLNPAPYNPRKNLQPGDPEYEKLKRSMQEFGYVEPIVWNKRTGNIVGGHQRYKVLLNMGAQEIDCVVVELDEAKEKALNVALNKISGDWNTALLKDLLLELDTGSLDITITGFDEEEIEALMTNTAPMDIDELLEDLDMSEAVEKPIWAVIRTPASNQEILERALSLLEQNGLKVERSYET